MRNFFSSYSIIVSLAVVATSSFLAVGIVLLSDVVTKRIPFVYLVETEYTNEEQKVYNIERSSLGLSEPVAYELYYDEVMYANEGSCDSITCPWEVHLSLLYVSQGEEKLLKDTTIRFHNE